MALSKIASRSKNISTEDVLDFSEGEDFNMGFDESAMSMITALLTDQYSFPIVSTVREIVSNALDAVMLLPEEERRPVEVKLPTAFSPFFEVIDHGVGMSRHTMRHVYSQYGASQKGENFDLLGAFGLGAKTPLAYGTEFLVVTTQDGVTTECTLSRESLRNAGKIISCRETGLPNGTRVSIPVRLEDAEAFRRALENYKFFTDEVSILVDGEPLQAKEEAILLGEYLFDEETATKGRVWLPRTSLEDFFFDRYGGDFVVDFVLSGWVYNTLSEEQRWRRSNNSLMVELKPGVVDFSASRDAITRNHRLETLLKGLNEGFLENRMRFLQTVMERLDRPTYMSLALKALPLLPPNFTGENAVPGINVGVQYRYGQAYVAPVVGGPEGSLVKNLADEGGYNVFLELQKARDAASSCYGMVITTEDTYRSWRKTKSWATTAVLLNDKSEPDKTFANGYRGTVESLKDATASVVHRRENATTFPLTLGVLYTMKHLNWSGERKERNKLLLVKITSEKAVQAFGRSRKAFLEKYPNMDLTVAFLQEEALPEEKDILGLVSDNIEEMTEEAFLQVITDAAAAKREAAKAANGKSASEEELVGWTFTLPNSHPAQAYNDWRRTTHRLYNAMRVGSVQEQVDKGRLILAMRDADDLPSLLIALANREVSLAGREVTVVLKLLVRQLEDLKDYEDFYMASSFKATGKALEEYREKAGVPLASAFTVEASGLSPDDLLLQLLRRGNVSYRTLSTDLTFLRDTPYQEAYEMVKRMANSENPYSFVPVEATSFEVLKDQVEEEVLERALVLSNITPAYLKLHLRDAASANLYASLLAGETVADDPLRTFAEKRVVEVLEDIRSTRTDWSSNV